MFSLCVLLQARPQPFTNRCLPEKRNKMGTLGATIRCRLYVRVIVVHYFIVEPRLRPCMVRMLSSTCAQTARCARSGVS